MEITIKADGDEHRFKGEPSVAPPERPPPMPPPAEYDSSHWHWLSPEEAAVVQATSGEYQPAKLLLEKTGLIMSLSEFKPILRNMIRRCILESEPGEGYRLTKPSSKCPEQQQ